MTSLFVYGTLMPGHLRWPMLAGAAARWDPAEVPGALYDTGHGWPAARFAELEDVPIEGSIPGWVVSFPTGRLEELLPTLDEMEGIGPVPDGRRDPYVRARVAVSGADGAWAYHATSVGPAWRRIAAWDSQAEA